MEDFVLFASWFGFLWGCLRVAAAIAVFVAVGGAVAVICSIAGANPYLGVALGIVAGSVAGGVTYYMMGPVGPPQPPEPPIVKKYQELKIPIVFIPSEESPTGGEPQKARPFECKIQKMGTWIEIHESSQEAMISKIRSVFQDIANHRTIDKSNEYNFTIDVYTKPFPGDSILKLIAQEYKAIFKGEKDSYNTYEQLYEGSPTL